MTFKEGKIEVTPMDYDMFCEYVQQVYPDFLEDFKAEVKKRPQDDPFSILDSVRCKGHEPPPDIATRMIGER